MKTQPVITRMIKYLIPLLLLLVPLAAEAQDEDHASTTIVFWPAGDNGVALGDFPEIQLRFSIVEGRNKYVSEIEQTKLTLFEADQLIELFPGALSNPEFQAVENVLILDRLAENEMPSFDMLENLVEQVGQNSNPHDRWRFCARTTSPPCFASLADHDFNGQPNQLPLEQIHEELSRITETNGVVTNNDLNTILRQVLSISPSKTPKVIVIAKLTPNLPPAYISDAVINDWLLADTPLSLAVINFVNADDEQDPRLHEDMQARLSVLDAEYFKSGGEGDEYWRGGLGKRIKKFRPAVFTLTYHSHLFRSEGEHVIRLDYDGVAREDVKIRFSRTDPRARYSSLNVFVKGLDAMLKFVLPLILVIVLVRSYDDLVPCDAAELPADGT